MRSFGYRAKCCSPLISSSPLARIIAAFAKQVRMLHSDATLFGDYVNQESLRVVSFQFERI